MPDKSQPGKKYEWASRILLSLHFLIVISGYFNWVQLNWQLDTPLIPKSTISILAEPAVYTGLCLAVSFIASLWFYFFRKKLAAIIISSLSLIGYELLLNYFAG